MTDTEYIKEMLEDLLIQQNATVQAVGRLTALIKELKTEKIQMCDTLEKQ